MAKPRIAWHYTTGECFSGIANEQRIRLEVGVILNKRERRCVWFSTSDQYEPTALKARVLPDGSTHAFRTAAEQAPYCKGLVRIGVPTNRLHPYEYWLNRSGVRAHDAAGLQAIAVSEGANPERDWHVSFNPVKSNAWEAIELSDDGVNWRPIRELFAAKQGGRG